MHNSICLPAPPHLHPQLETFAIFKLREPHTYAHESPVSWANPNRTAKAQVVLVRHPSGARQMGLRCHSLTPGKSHMLPAQALPSTCLVGPACSGWRAKDARALPATGTSPPPREPRGIFTQRGNLLSQLHFRCHPPNDLWR